MTASSVPGPDVTGARDLVDLALEGARMNERPDLLRRLTVVREALATPASSIQADAVRSAATAVLQALDSLVVDLHARRATLADPIRAGRLHAERDRARELLDQFQARASGWGQVLAEAFATVHSDLDFRMLTGIRAVLAEAEQVLATTDPARNSHQLDRWVDERLTAEVADIHQRLHDGARAVAVQLADHLQLPTVPPVLAPPVTPAPQLVAALPVRTRTSAPPRRGAVRMLTVAMPTYGGIMMGLVFPQILNLALPGWLLVICSVVCAVTMGGAAVIVERQQQRESRRNQLRMTVQGKGDDCLLTLGKQVRDALRVLQQELREATGAAVTRYDDLLNSRYQAAAAAAGAADHAATALSGIDADLECIRQLRAQGRDLLLPPPRTRQQPTPTPVLHVVS